MPDRHDEETEADLRGQTVRGLDRLCEIFDPLLTDAAHTLYSDQKSELAALARIFDLPTDKEPAQVWAEVRALLVVTPGEGATSSPLTIMVVEQDPQTASDLLAELSCAGHRVIGSFDSAETAEVSAALHQIDLAMIDVDLAGEADGLDLARSLRGRWNMATILMSENIVSLTSVGDLGDALVLKPISGANLRATIASVMAA
ncbi:response regulator [Brevundimonas lenta]|uniref:CheY-like chemotaxis protein n=1 Tax=Brevundimonas lenta TaxID=424796 RepID=A0A7W6JET4_9CAUL|nr:response regulator [Brevundimonas lenta]MBB4082828.1 CheY-like chemotaxis protein [Brevundimonas lenta]